MPDRQFLRLPQLLLPLVSPHLQLSLLLGLLPELLPLTPSFDLPDSPLQPKPRHPHPPAAGSHLGLPIPRLSPQGCLQLLARWVQARAKGLARIELSQQAPEMAALESRLQCACGRTGSA